MSQPTALSAICRNLVLLTIIFIFCTYRSFSQQATGSQTFDSLQSYIEKNYAGFADKVNPKTQKAYQAITKRSSENAKRAQSAAEQYYIIQNWLDFFNDHHLYIDFLTDTAHTEKIPVKLRAEGWLKHGTTLKKETATAAEAVTNRFEEENRLSTFFKKLNDSTGYLRIKSFDGSEARNIDSVIAANKQNIQSMPRLIIDVRGNGGGSDYSMSFLRPLLYTNPVKNIGVDLLTTPDNTAAWERAIKRYRGQLPDRYLDDALKKIHRGDGKERAFINFVPDKIDTLPGVWPNPAKVAIIINGGCGSATEEFLLVARQSKKVTFAGEHSVGGLDYSNVVHRDFSFPPFTLTYPTTRSRRIDVGLGIDNKGIQPNIPLNLTNNNWLNELVRKW